MPQRDVSFDVERHDGDEQAVCVGQWCCGCSEHPIGKPWGWASERWAKHYETCPRGAATTRSEAQALKPRYTVCYAPDEGWVGAWQIVDNLGNDFGPLTIDRGRDEADVLARAIALNAEHEATQARSAA